MNFDVVLWSTVGTAVWSFVGSMTGFTVNKRMQTHCPRHTGRSGKDCSFEYCTHPWMGVFGGIFWPVTIPMALGKKSAEPISEPRVDRKRRIEIENAEHDLQLEQIKLEYDRTTTERLALTTGREWDDLE